MQKQSDGAASHSRAH